MTGKSADDPSHRPSPSRPSFNKLGMTRNMVISSTIFTHKVIHKQTWVSPDGQTRNQIDHVVVDGRIKICIIYVQCIICIIAWKVPMVY